VDYKTLHLKMKRYGIDARQFRAFWCRDENCSSIRVLWWLRHGSRTIGLAAAPDFAAIEFLSPRLPRFIRRHTVHEFIR